MTDSTKRPGITIQQIFLESASFSHRKDHLSLPSSTTPVVGDVDILIASGLSEDRGKGLVRVRVRTRPANKPMYNFDVTFVGLFRPEDGFENMPLEEFLSTNGVAMLFPFVRQVVADTTMKGRFGPIWLSPLNTTPVTDKLKAAKPTKATIKKKATIKRKKKRTSVRRKTKE